jgi:protein tyrosine phosphatase (PTP) superfamily phosphohydrolase (DUF442 family)
MLRRHLSWLVLLVGSAACSLIPSPSIDLNAVGEKATSEDPAIGDFHALGVINGYDRLFRSAAPLRDLIKNASLRPDSEEARAIAADRMASLRSRGIRTIIAFETADSAEAEDKAAWIALERAAAQQAGLSYLSCPLANSGPDSLETMSDQEVLAALVALDRVIFQNAAKGGVLIHCSAGHDRTGIVVAFLRLKYDHWTADRAIEEMRFFGHNWPKYSHNGGTSSWHEDHIRALAALPSSDLGVHEALP